MLTVMELKPKKPFVVAVHILGGSSAKHWAGCLPVLPPILGVIVSILWARRGIPRHWG